MSARLVSIALITLISTCAVTPLHAASDDDRYTIMRPAPGRHQADPFEPWLAPKYKSPRGTKQNIVVPRPSEPERPRVPTVPPPLVSPRTGQVVPNIPPPAPGSGVGGHETFQDRAARCVHQSGVYGQSGDGNYVSTCIGQ
jgi:hypothetical protein